MDDRLEANRRNWDERVALHAGSAFYDVAGWLSERRGPRPEELRAVGDVAGRSLVHLQCHFGMDTLQWARAGATVTGVDFSASAIAEATSLAERAGLADSARFVCSDVYDARAALGGARFDVAYVSLGSLCWLPDVARWADVVAGLLAPSGVLYLHDVHPLSQVFDDEEGETVAYSYFEEPEGYADDFPYTYTDGEARLDNTRTYWWNHSLGEIVGALLDRGLAVERLEEHDWTVFRQFPWLVEAPGGRFEIPAGRPRLPLAFTVIARAPAGAPVR